MGGIILSVAVILIFIAGICRVRTLSTEEDLPVLCLALNEGEYAESLIRASISWMGRKELAGRLVVLVEDSWEAWHIAARLSEKTFFTAVNLAEGGLLLDNNRLRVLDLRNRGRGGRALLGKYFRGCNMGTNKA